jgi:hypothetical protein
VSAAETGQHTPPETSPASLASSLAASPTASPAGSTAPPRGLLADAWYYTRITVLTLLAIVVVSFMASAIILSTWPRLGGDYLAPIFEKTQKAELPKRDWAEQKRRWPYYPPGDQVGRTPAEQRQYERDVTGASASATAPAP